MPSSEFNRVLTPYRLDLAKGVYDIHTNRMQYPAIFQPTHARIEQLPPSDETEIAGPNTKFEPIRPVVARNFSVVDTYMETPPAGVSPLAYDANPIAEFLGPFKGLSAISDDIKDLLPPECRKAFDEALANETSWKEKWRNEKESSCRRNPIIDKSIVPQPPPQ
jgi:chromatin structure-remodeling complex protein RSC7